MKTGNKMKKGVNDVRDTVRITVKDKVKDLKREVGESVSEVAEAVKVGILLLLCCCIFVRFLCIFCVFFSCFFVLCFFCVCVFRVSSVFLCFWMFILFYYVSVLFWATIEDNVKGLRDIGESVSEVAEAVKVGVL